MILVTITRDKNDTQRVTCFSKSFPKQLTLNSAILSVSSRCSGELFGPKLLEMNVRSWEEPGCFQFCRIPQAGPGTLEITELITTCQAQGVCICSQERNRQEKKHHNSAVKNETLVSRCPAQTYRITVFYRED